MKTDQNTITPFGIKVVAKCKVLSKHKSWVTKNARNYGL